MGWYLYLTDLNNLLLHVCSLGFSTDVRKSVLGLSVCLTVAARIELGMQEKNMVTEGKMCRENFCNSET